MKKFIPIAFVLGEQAFFSLFNFALMIWVIRTYSADVAGVFALAWTVSFLIYSLAEALIFNPFAKLVSMGRFSIDEEAKISFFSLILFVVSSELLILAASYIFSDIWGAALRISLAMSPGIVVGYFLRRILISSGRSHVSILLMIVQSIVFIVLMYLYGSNRSVNVVGYAWLVSVLLTGVFFYIDLICGVYLIGFSRCLAGSKMLWFFGRWNLLALLPVIMSSFAITPIVSYSHSISAVAVLRALQSLTSPLHQAQAAVYSYFLSRSRMVKLDSRALITCSSLAVTAFVLMFFWSENVLQLIYGDNFIGAEFLPYFALAMLLESATQYICFYFQVVGEYKSITIIRFYGVVGLLAGSVIVYTINGSFLKFGYLTVALGCFICGLVLIKRRQFKKNERFT